MYRGIRIKSRPIIVALCAVVLGAYCISAVAESLTDRAQRLIVAGQAETAYRLLLGAERQRAGTPSYDLELGLAALDSGHPADAVFAFERVLSVEPGNGRARVELARAYFVMGENQAAERAFTTVLSEKPPKAVAAHIRSYLSAIGRRFAQTEQRFSAYIEAGLGYDDNVNTAPSDTQVAVPALGDLVVELAPGSVKQADSIGDLKLGVNYTAPLRNDIHAFAGATGDLRRNLSKQQFDTDNIGLFTGVRVLRGWNRYSVTVRAGQVGLHEHLLRDTLGLNLQWQRTLDARNEVSAYGQLVQFRYPHEAVRNVDQQTLGAAWAHALDRAGAPVVYLGLYLGRELNQTASRPDVGRHFVGVRFGGDYSLNSRLTFNSGAAIERSRYGADDPIFLRRRTGTLFDLGMGLDYRLARRWSLRPRLHFTRNDSNISIYDFSRTWLLLNLRRDFD